MGDTMTRDEVEAVIAKIEARADAREEGGASEWHEAEGMRIAVEMLREALAKSELAEGGSFICLACSARGHSPEDIKHADRCPYKVAL